MKTKLLILMILASILPVGYAYAWEGGDNTDKLSNSQSSVFSPGYINAAKQQAYEIINQNNKPKSWWGNLVDKVKNKTSDNIETDTNTNLQPDLKKKTSAKNASTTITTISEEPTLIDSMTYNVSAGDGSTRVINGSTHRFVGFGGEYGNSITSAMEAASAGDIIIVRGDLTYDEMITIKNGVKLYGGYDISGNRNISTTPTIINGGFIASGITDDTEINGFTIRGQIDTTRENLGIDSTAIYISGCNAGGYRYQ